jgi:hypothetical protein
MSEHRAKERLAAIISALGFPDNHTAQVIRRKKPLPNGITILDDVGRAVAFFTEAQLHKLADEDRNFRTGFDEKLPPPVLPSVPSDT